MKDDIKLSQNIVYKLLDKPPFFESLFIGIQHVLSMFVSIAATPLIIATAIGLSEKDTAFFISMALIASGISTFIQVRKFGAIGSGLLSTQGTSFSFISVFIAAAKSGGIELALFTSIITAPVEAIISRFTKLFRKLFPPEVTGIVVLLIGLTLIRVGAANIAGGFGSKDFGSPFNLLLGLFTIAIIININSLKMPMLRTLSIIIGITAGYLVALFFGKVDFSPFLNAGWYTIPIPFYFGLKPGIDYILPFSIIYIVTTIESIGDITATSSCSAEPISGKIYEERVRSGVLGDSINSIIAGILNSPPNTTFSQNNGIIQLTGVASKKVGYFIAIILILLGFFPKVAGLVMTIPPPVIGGAMLILFGVISATGIRMIKDSIDHRKMIILSVSLGIGLGITFFPELLDKLPNYVRNLFSSGIATGGMTAVILNLLIPKNDEKG